MAVTHNNSEQVVAIYKCLCDLKRLRILNLLRTGPQCVCHIEGVLGIGPARTSQQLAYLRRHGMVEVEVRGTWRVYSLPADPVRNLPPTSRVFRTASSKARCSARISCA